MAAVYTQQPSIVRTERGLTIRGTRITLYDIMDYLTEQYPTKFIRSLFSLTDKQMNVALSYIEANRIEVERDYRIVLREAEQNRKYWEERSRDYFIRAAAVSPKPGREALWAKLRNQQAEHAPEL